MKIYFAGSILGGRDNLRVFQHIVARLKSLGHDVPSEHVASPGVLDDERPLSPRHIYERDVAWLRESDAVIAEASTPSLGVGYEIAYALERGTPVLCLYRDGLAVSKMITGNASPHIRAITYRDLDELDRHVDRFLSDLRQVHNPG